MWTLVRVQTDLDDFLGPERTPTTWDIKLKVFKREDKNAEFRLRQNLSMGEADFNQFIRKKTPTSCCSRQLSQRTEFVASPSIYTVQRHGGATEACSQGD